MTAHASKIEPVRRPRGRPRKQPGQIATQPKPDNIAPILLSLRIRPGTAALLG